MCLLWVMSPDLWFGSRIPCRHACYLYNTLRVIMKLDITYTCCKVDCCISCSLNMSVNMHVTHHKIPKSMLQVHMFVKHFTVYIYMCAAVPLHIYNQCTWTHSLLVLMICVRRTTRVVNLKANLFVFITLGLFYNTFCCFFSFGTCM